MIFDLSRRKEFQLELSTVTFEGRAKEKNFRSNRGRVAKTYPGSPTRILFVGYETFLR